MRYRCHWRSAVLFALPRPRVRWPLLAARAFVLVTLLAVLERLHVWAVKSYPSAVRPWEQRLLGWLHCSDARFVGLGAVRAATEVESRDGRGKRFAELEAGSALA